MTTCRSKFLKLNGRSSLAIEKQNLNCVDFSRSSTPDLKQLDNYMFVEYVGQRHIYPQRVSSARSKHVSGLKLTYFTPDHISYLQETSNDLQRLDLSNSNLFKLPMDIIYNMNHLQVLILDNNQLTESAFCKEFCDILGNSLKELSVCSNSISHLPDLINNLKKLSRLKMTNNIISSIRDIDKLKKLKILNLDSNQLSQLGNEFYQIKRLEYAYLSRNTLTSISLAIRYMNNLKEIDLSYNSLKSVPSDIFLLENLEILKLNDNKIGKLPKFKVSGKLEKLLVSVDISSNNIIRFPDCIMRITEQLDLSNNKIRIITSNILKQIPYTTSQKLYLANNPLFNPPKEICDSGLRCMIQFFQESKTVETCNHGLKIFCLSSQNVDKLNIISALIDPNDDEDLTTKNDGILEIYDTAFDLTDQNSGENRLLNLQFIDIFASDSEQEWLLLFTTCPALILIFVDINDYCKESYMESIGLWLQYVVLKQNEISFMVVGVTRLSNTDNQLNVLKRIQLDIKEFFNKYVDKIINEIHNIESQTKINASMSLVLKKLIQLKSVKILMHEQSVLVNSKSTKSIKDLHEEIIIMSTQTNVFKNVMTSIPKFWSDVQLYFEEKSYTFPLMTVKEYEAFMQQKFSLKNVALKIANFLHETGYILWWEQSPSPLNQWIITCPFSIVQCLRILFRSDLKDYLDDPSNPDKIYKRFKQRFTKCVYNYKECCNILFNKSILLPELATILWENIIPFKYIIRMLYFLCECWFLGYLINYSNYPPSNWGDIKSTINNTEILSSGNNIQQRLKSAESSKSIGSSQNNLPPIFFPWFLTRNKCSDAANKAWRFKNIYQICVLYKFPLGLQKLISHQVLVRAITKENSQIKVIDHWVTGAQGEIENTKMIFRIHRNEFKKDEILLKFEFRFIDNDKDIDLRSDVANKQSSDIWQIMLKFLIDTDDLLESYKGLWYEKLIECPYCQKASFIGTWSDIKDDMSDEDKLCQLCGKWVPIHVLSPPKLNKILLPEDVLKSIRKHYDRE